jgi:LysM repeat protein
MFKKACIAALCLLMATIIGLAAAVISLNGNQKAYLSMNEQARSLLKDRIVKQQSEIERQNAKIDKQRVRIDELEETLPLQNAHGATGAEELLRQLKQSRALLAQRESELGEMKALLAGIGRKTGGKLVYFKRYVVERGDSLRSICRKNGLSYLSNRKLILGINGIKDEDMITIGQTILLPAIIVLE